MHVYRAFFLEAKNLRYVIENTKNSSTSCLRILTRKINFPDVRHVLCSLFYPDGLSHQTSLISLISLEEKELDQMA